MYHCTTARNYENRVTLLSMAGDSAEVCGNLLGSDRSLTAEQRFQLVALMEAAWAVRDGLTSCVAEAPYESPFPSDDEPTATAFEPLYAAME